MMYVWNYSSSVVGPKILTGLLEILNYPHNWIIYSPTSIWVKTWYMVYGHPSNKGSPSVISYGWIEARPPTWVYNQTLNAGLTSLSDFSVT